jgi:hypothetical protein
MWYPRTTGGGGGGGERGMYPRTQGGGGEVFFGKPCQLGPLPGKKLESCDAAIAAEWCDETHDALAFLSLTNDTSFLT